MAFLEKLCNTEFRWLKHSDAEFLSETKRRQRLCVLAQVQTRGYHQVIDEVAYTLFIRFCVLRYMEVNGYLPSGVRGLSGCNCAFKTLLADNVLGEVLPRMFSTDGRICGTVVSRRPAVWKCIFQLPINEIDATCFQSGVQIIGWLYQFYNSEKKYAVLAKKGPVNKDDIPARTQLFTPEWIVRYLVENSLGRLWVLGNPASSLHAEWRYYLDDAEQEPRVLRPYALSICQVWRVASEVMEKLDVWFWIFNVESWEPL